MKHYTISVYEKPPLGAFIRYDGINAENKSDLKRKVSEWNLSHKDEYMALKTARIFR